MDLERIIDIMKEDGDDISYFYDRIGDEIVSYLDEYATVQEDELSSFSDWEREEIKKADEIILDTNDRYILITSPDEVFMYDTMSFFIEDIKEKEIREEFSKQITDIKSKPRFERLLHKYQLNQDWDIFLDNSYYRFAFDWAVENELILPDNDDEATRTIFRLSKKLKDLNPWDTFASSRPLHIKINSTQDVYCIFNKSPKLSVSMYGDAEGYNEASILLDYQKLGITLEMAESLQNCLKIYFAPENTYNLDQSILMNEVDIKFENDEYPHLLSYHKGRKPSLVISSREGMYYSLVYDILIAGLSMWKEQGINLDTSKNETLGIYVSNGGIDLSVEIDETDEIIPFENLEDYSEDQFEFIQQKVAIKVGCLNQYISQVGLAPSFMRYGIIIYDTELNEVDYVNAKIDYREDVFSQLQDAMIDHFIEAGLPTDIVVGDEVSKTLIDSLSMLCHIEKEDLTEYDSIFEEAFKAFLEQEEENA